MSGGRRQCYLQLLNIMLVRIACALHFLYPLLLIFDDPADANVNTGIRASGCGVAADLDI